MFLVGLCFRRRDSQTDKTRTLDAQPSSGGKIRDLAPTDQCVSVCRCRCVCVSPGTRCKCVCVYVRGWDVGTGSREEEKLWIGRRWGKSSLVELQASKLLTLLTGHCNCDSDGESARAQAQSQALHGTAEHVLIHCSLCAIPPGPTPSIIPSTRPVSDHHRPPTKSLETRVLLALRGGTALAIRGLVSGSHILGL